MTYVEIARAESERGEIVLRRREQPRATELRVNGVFVMDTLETSTEQALAREALAAVEVPRRVLVGGLGLGFTTRAVLDDPRVEHCTVVEIEQVLVDWMRDGTLCHGPALLADGRATIRVADVAAALAEAAEASYDVVLLDVDNGPGYLVLADNAALYRAPFLAVCRRAVAPGGAVVVWSAEAAPDLEAALGEVFDDVVARAHEVSLQGRAEHYWLYCARVRSST